MILLHAFKSIAHRKSKNSKWVWSGYITLRNCIQTRQIVRKSHTTITRHQEDKQSKANTYILPIKMIAILEWTQSNAQQNIEQLQKPTIRVTFNNEPHFRNRRDCVFIYWFVTESCILFPTERPKSILRNRLVWILTWLSLGQVFNPIIHGSHQKFKNSIKEQAWLSPKWLGLS